MTACGARPPALSLLNVCYSDCVPRLAMTDLGRLRPFVDRHRITVGHETGRALAGSDGLSGSRIVNSLYSPILLSTVMLPP
jgi:hypothetical protein